MKNWRHKNPFYCPQISKSLRLSLSPQILRTAGQIREQRLQLGIAVLVVVFIQVAPESLDGGSALLQDPGEQRVHCLVDALSALLLQSVL